MRHLPQNPGWPSDTPGRGAMKASSGSKSLRGRRGPPLPGEKTQVTDGHYASTKMSTPSTYTLYILYYLLSYVNMSYKWTCLFWLFDLHRSPETCADFGHGSCHSGSSGSRTFLTPNLPQWSGEIVHHPYWAVRHKVPENLLCLRHHHLSIFITPITMVYDTYNYSQWGL